MEDELKAEGLRAKDKCLFEERMKLVYEFQTRLKELDDEIFANNRELVKLLAAIDLRKRKEEV